MPDPTPSKAEDAESNAPSMETVEPSAASSETQVAPSSNSHEAEDTPPIHSSQTEDVPSLTTSKPLETAVADDSDPDFDDLDDVLDQFSASAATPAKSALQSAPTASGPGRPDDIPVPMGIGENETEEDFMARLTAEMQSAMSKMSTDPSASASSPEEIARMGQELDEFTRKMEAQGIRPEDLLKAILGEETGRQVSEDAHKERDRRESEVTDSEFSDPNSKDERPSASKPRFEDTIRRTMERIEESDTKATSATKETGNSEEDMLAQLLKAMDTGGEDGDGELSKMFMGMMEQLTNKDMLYEPMKELDVKYPDWLAKNKSKLPSGDYTRFTNQQKIVKEIVTKFEERGYSDEDSRCREYIWERMQKMQAEGSPPEDLIANPFPGMGGVPDLGGAGGSGPGEDVGCPTQ